jgi:hypothetical protein
MNKNKKIAMQRKDLKGLANSLFQELTNTKTTRLSKTELILFYYVTIVAIKRIKTHIKRVEAGKIKYPTDYDKDKTVLKMLQNLLKKLNKQNLKDIYNG